MGSKGRGVLRGTLLFLFWGAAVGLGCRVLVGYHYLCERIECVVDLYLVVQYGDSDSWYGLRGTRERRVFC